MKINRALSSVIYLAVIMSLVLAACAQPAPPPTAAPAQTEAPAQQVTVAPAEPATQPPAETQAPPAETQAPESKGKVATFIWTQEFDSLNPAYTNMWFSIVTQQLWNCWAWAFNEKNEPFPNLVTEIPTPQNGGISSDGTVITMTLRQDIKWSDNTPITSEDFIFTYNMYMDPKNTVASTYPYDKVKSMTAPDATTVVITFNEPYAPWLAHFWKGLIPAHILKPTYEKEGSIDKAEWNLKPEVGCGPYVFKEWESGSFARFVINENYWGEKPKIDEIFMRFVPDDASQTAALKAGDGDLGAFIPISDIPTLKDNGVNIMTEQSGFNEGWFFMINEEKSHPAMMDVRVRKAIAMALNREALNKDLLLGLTNVPASYWDALPFWNNPPLENYPYDPEGAKKLLDEAGWIDANGDGVREKDGKDLVIRHGTTIREVRQNAQAVAQQDLAAVGIKLEIQSYDDTIFFSGYGENGPAYSGKLDIQEWSDSPAFPDPDIYYWLCSEIPSDDNPQGTNSFFLCDEELDALIKQQLTQMDQVERQKTVQKINQIFHDKVYWLGLWQDPDVWAISSRLQNVTISGVTPFFSIAQWDLK